MIRTFFCGVLLLALCPTVSPSQTITFTPTSGVQTFAKREPVLRLKPGAIVETRTFSKPGDYYEALEIYSARGGEAGFAAKRGSAGRAIPRTPPV